mgnify:CR=1 FL=1
MCVSGLVGITLLMAAMTDLFTDLDIFKSKNMLGLGLIFFCIVSLIVLPFIWKYALKYKLKK